MSSLRPYVDNTSFCASPEAVFVSSAEEAASEPAAWLPAAVVSVVDAPPQAQASLLRKVQLLLFFHGFSPLSLFFEIMFCSHPAGPCIPHRLHKWAVIFSRMNMGLFRELSVHIPHIQRWFTYLFSIRRTIRSFRFLPSAHDLRPTISVPIFSPGSVYPSADTADLLALFVNMVRSHIYL